MDTIMIETCKAISTILLDEEISDKVKTLRMDALMQLVQIMGDYLNEFHNEALITKIFEKKLAFIMDASTKKEITEIMSSRMVRFDGVRVQPDNSYVIPEEELLIWSRTSLVAPLNEFGFDRMMKLFKEIYPDYADKL